MKKTTGTELFLLRHGETEWNLEKRFQGQLDSPLTPNGMKQAELLAEFLREIRFDIMICSDLGRAMHTAEILNNTLLVSEVIQDPRIRERNFGIFHGLNRKEAFEKYPYEASQIWGGDHNFIIPEGESRAQVRERAQRFLYDTPLKYPGKKILAITHGGIVNAIIREVLHIPFEVPRRFKLPNTGLNILCWEEEEWYVKSMGILAHLNNSAVYDETI